MAGIRISGIVKAANILRNGLKPPVSPSRLEEMRAFAAKTVSEVYAILDDDGYALADLPPQSRKAMAYIESIDFDNMETDGDHAPGDTREPADASVGFTGVRAARNRFMEMMARDEGEDILPLIQRAGRTLEDAIAGKGYRGRHLKRETWKVRGWLAFFAQEEHFRRYRAAVRAAVDALADGAGEAGRRLPLSVYFLQANYLYRLKSTETGTELRLPVEMITFGPAEFSLLGDVMFADADDTLLAESLRSDEAEALLLEIEALAGAREEAAGIAFDLRAVFERVRDRYFDDQYGVPRLAWSDTYNARLLACYDRTADRIIISAGLDRHDVPPVLIEYLMYHEMLHRLLGVQRGACRHDRAFATMESRFEGIDRATAYLMREAFF